MASAVRVGASRRLGGLSVGSIARLAVLTKRCAGAVRPPRLLRRGRARRLVERAVRRLFRIESKGCSPRVSGLECPRRSPRGTFPASLGLGGGHAPWPRGDLPGVAGGRGGGVRLGSFSKGRSVSLSWQAFEMACPLWPGQEEVILAAQTTPKPPRKTVPQ